MIVIMIYYDNNMMLHDMIERVTWNNYLPLYNAEPFCTTLKCTTQQHAGL